MPIAVGSGTDNAVRMAPSPLPAPATVADPHRKWASPSLAGTIEGELCTPTGAALLAEFSTMLLPESWLYDSFSRIRRTAPGIPAMPPMF